MSHTDIPNGRRLATIPNMARLPEYREAFTLSSLRHLVFQAKNRINSREQTILGNGLEEAIVRIGRKVLIDLDAFDAWLMNHKTGG